MGNSLEYSNMGRSMNYIEAKQIADRLNAESSALGAVLESFPRNAVGLVSDEVRVTPEYQQAKAAFDRSFARLRAFNAVFVKQYKRERAADRAARLN